MRMVEDVCARAGFFPAVAFSRGNRPNASSSRTRLWRTSKARMSRRRFQGRISDVKGLWRRIMLRYGLSCLISFRIL